MESKSWKPHDKQVKFIMIPPTIKEGFYGGAASGGKSEILILLPILYGFHQIPGFKGLLLRRTYGELDEELVIRSKEYYTSTGGIYTGGDQRRWKWPAYDSYIKFGHAQHEQDIRRYDTTEYQYIAFDELTSFTEFQYTYMFSRLRSAIPGLIPICRSASNPGNVGHGWVRKRFVEPYPQGGRIIYDTLTKTKRIFIPATVMDNPYIMEADPDYINTLNLLPEAEKRAKLYGDWWTFTGQAFDEWRIEPFPGEPDNAKHVLKAEDDLSKEDVENGKEAETFDIPDWWPRLLVIDWGYAANLYACWGAISPDKRLYIYREYFGKKLKVDEWAVDIRNLSVGEKFVDIVLDSTCFEERGEDQTIAEQFQFYSKFVPRPADKGKGSRISGKVLLQDFIRWQAKKKLDFGPVAPFDSMVAQDILRRDGLSSYHSYLQQYKPEEPEKNLPRLQVFGNCKELIRVIPLCVHDEKNKEDVAEFEGDDPYDTVRYMIRAVKRFQERPKRQQEINQQVAAARQSLDKTGDQTEYQRKMGVLAEKSKRIGPQPKKFRRGRRARRSIQL